MWICYSCVQYSKRSAELNVPVLGLCQVKPCQVCGGYPLEMCKTDNKTRESMQVVNNKKIFAHKYIILIVIWIMAQSRQQHLLGKEPLELHLVHRQPCGNGINLLVSAPPQTLILVSLWFPDVNRAGQKNIEKKIELINQKDMRLM